MDDHSLIIYILLLISLFIGLILCFFGYRLDQYLTSLLKRQDRFYDSIVHQIFPGPRRSILNLSLIPKLLYMLFWTIFSALIQGFGHIIKVFAIGIFIVSIDLMLSVVFHWPSFFSLSRSYALAAIIVLSIIYVVTEIYYSTFTKMFVIFTTAFTGAFIAISVLIYTGNNTFFPLSEDFIRAHFTYSIIFLWIALGFFGLFVQYKEDREQNVIKWDDDWN